MTKNLGIPIIDLSPFCRKNGEEDQSKTAEEERAMEEIAKACSGCGFFMIKNHGVPLDLMSKALDLSKKFFDYSDVEKQKVRSCSDLPLPAGYAKQPANSPDKNEYLVIHPPSSTFNVFPTNPPHFKEVLEEIFLYLRNTSRVVEKIINQCQDLPPNFLKEFNDDRTGDFMAALHYFPATENENNGITPHEDGNCVTLLFQDDVGGLEVLRDGEWIPVTPVKGTIVVNLGDVIQVLTNERYKSATHRVVREKGRNRYSYAFFYNLDGGKWVEPLSHFTSAIGAPPKYRGFLYKDYMRLRVKNKTDPPNPEDVVHITHYKITLEKQKQMGKRLNFICVVVVFWHFCLFKLGNVVQIIEKY